MLIVKIMCENTFADDHHNANFMLIQVPEGRRIQFTQNTVPEGRVGLKDGERFNVEIQNENGSDIYPLTGKAYVMNVNGKTIATHGV